MQNDPVHKILQMQRKLHVLILIDEISHLISAVFSLSVQGFTIEESFLETPTSILAIVFLILQAMCIIFQFIVNSLKRLFRSKNRLGMVTALDHSVWELTLVGFISLCLIALQTQITSICGTFPLYLKISTFLNSLAIATAVATVAI
jgi:hypothetical protein